MTGINTIDKKIGQGGRTQKILHRGALSSALQDYCLHRGTSYNDLPKSMRPAVEDRIVKNSSSVYTCNMNRLISSATQRNWERLGITAIGVKLKSRANKTSSDRIVFPIEYFHNKNNIPLIQNIVDYVAENNISLDHFLYSAALRCLEQKGLIQEGNARQQNVCDFIDEYEHLSCNKNVPVPNLPFDEMDLLGLLYQCLRSEGNRNQNGIYYTPFFVANMLLRDVDVSDSQCFLDPCCGSGNLLLHVPCKNPEHLYGVDSDPAAVMIAKCNLIMKYPGNDFSPRIFHRDFLETGGLFVKNMGNSVEGFFFDYIVTNPPWGAVSNLGNADFSQIHSRESFSAFLLKSMDYLLENGKLRFLLPESFLYIKTHSGIRSFILKQYHVEEIRTYPHTFSGVSTKFIDVTIAKNKHKNSTVFHTLDKRIFVDTSVFTKNTNFTFSVISRDDSRIINHVNNLGKHDLSESIFGMGIVTGDNKSKLYEVQNENMEAIYSGKEINPYHLLKAKYFIHYCREQFQQAAKDSIYRAPEKLAYKFISRKLVFAYDNTQSLFLNSANLLIPNMKGMNIKTVLAFLNSELYQFMYQKQFPDIKVLKGNLIALPFPEIDEETNGTITQMVDMILLGNEHLIPEIDTIIYNMYQLNDQEKKYIKDALKK